MRNFRRGWKRVSGRDNRYSKFSVAVRGYVREAFKGSIVFPLKGIPSTDFECEIVVRPQEISVDHGLCLFTTYSHRCMSSVRSYFPHQIIRIHSVPNMVSERIGDVIFACLQFAAESTYLLFVCDGFKAVSLRQSHQQRFKTIPQRDHLTAVFQTCRDLFDK